MFANFTIRSSCSVARMPAVPLASFIVAGVILVTAPLRADVAWTLPKGQSGAWSTASNWGDALPTGSDVAYIGNGGKAIITQPGEICDVLVLGYNPGESGTVQMISGGLSATQQYLGYSGTGNFTQSGGANSSDSYLDLGFNANSSGTYNLSGAGQLAADTENMGISGTGTFTQSGGANSSSSFLNLGWSAGGGGTYSLSGSGQLAADTENVGLYGRGTFTQTGGTNSFGSYLEFGYYAGSSGTYNLSGSGQVLSAFSTSEELLGLSGTGIFTQTGGTNSNSGYLNLGSNARASGTYTQSGGINLIGSFLDLGNNAGSSGTYNLSGAGKLAVGTENVGDYSGTGTFTQSGGTNSCSLLQLGYGTGGSGTYKLSGTGYLSVANNENVGLSGTGTFTQTGGTNNSGANLNLGYNTGSGGTYNLNGGMLVLASLGQGSGTAAFNFNGGTLQASSGFSTSQPMTLGTSGGGATFDTAGYSVTLSGLLSGPGSLNKVDSGALILSGTNSYSGGTTVSDGTLIAVSNTALPDGTSLTVGAGGTLVFDPSVAGVAVATSPLINAVPEPGTLALSAAGGLALLVGAWRRRKLSVRCVLRGLEVDKSSR